MRWISVNRCRPPAELNSAPAPTRAGESWLPEITTSSAPACRIATKASLHTCTRSEEHTSELQSRFDLVCRLLLEKKKIKHKLIPERLRIHICNRRTSID